MMTHYYAEVIYTNAIKAADVTTACSLCTAKVEIAGKSQFPLPLSVPHVAKSRDCMKAYVNVCKDGELELKDFGSNASKLTIFKDAAAATTYLKENIADYLTEREIATNNGWNALYA